MKFQTSLVASLVLVLVGCQSESRVTLFKPGSTPVDRRIAFNNCQDASYRTEKDAKARAQFIRSCMQDRGYTMLENLPVCPTAEARRRALRDPQPRRVEQMTCSSGVALDE